VPGRQAPFTHPICTEKRNYGALPPRIKIESHIERKEREPYIIYYIYIEGEE
jgi:hypothetical protein